MTRAPKIAAVSALILAAGIGGYMLLQQRRARVQEAADWEAAYRVYTFDQGKANEALSSLQPKIPPGENAAYIFSEANQELIRNSKGQFPEPPGSLSGNKPYDGDAAGFERYIQANQQVLKRVQDGLAHPCEVPFMIDEKAGTPSVALPVLADIRNLARFLADAGFAAELEARPDAAAERYLDCMRIGNQARETGPLITNLVGIAAQNIGRSGLEHLVANAPLDDATLKRVITMCRDMESTPEARLRVLQSEAEFAKATMALSKERAAAFGKDYDAYMAFVGHQYAKPLPELIRSAAAAAKQAKDKYPALEGQAPPYLERMPEQWGRTDLGLRVLEIRAAFSMYLKAHADAAEGLDALVPEFLPEVPLDPFSGKPIRYAKTADGWKV